MQANNLTSCILVESFVHCLYEMSGQSKTVELISTLLYYLSKDGNTCLRNEFQVLQQSSLTKHKLTGNNNASYFKIYASHMTTHLDSVETN